MACGVDTIETLKESKCIDAAEEEDYESIEQLATQILNDFEGDLEEIYEMDAHWQTDPSDYGRMAVRRLSQELTTGSPQARRMSGDLGFLPRRSVPLTRRQSDFGLVGGVRTCLENVARSKFKRRLSMDQNLFGRVLPDRGLPEGVLWENAGSRKPSCGFIDEIPEVSVIIYAFVSTVVGWESQ